MRHSPQECQDFEVVGGHGQGRLAGPVALSSQTHYSAQRIPISMEHHRQAGVPEGFFRLAESNSQSIDILNEGKVKRNQDAGYSNNACTTYTCPLTEWGGLLI